MKTDIEIVLTPLGKEGKQNFKEILIGSLTEKTCLLPMDPILSMGRRDSLLNEKKKIKVGIFEFWKIHSPGGTVLFRVVTYFLFLFY